MSQHSTQGEPMPEPFLPYGRQTITDEDVAAVTRVLRSDYLTQGPEVEAFEADLARNLGARHAVAFCNGTAALHACAFAAGLGPGQELITSPITFAASANCALYQGGKPVFADVEPVAATLDPQAFAAAISPRTRAVVPVHYAGQPAQMAAIAAIARSHGICVIEDAAHAIGATCQGQPIGACEHSDMTIFSFHPVKHVTTGEGGAVTTNDLALAERLRCFRSHGMVREPEQLTIPSPGPWYHEQQHLGYNYRITDIQAALGRSQLTRLGATIDRRQAIAARYDAQLSGVKGLTAPGRLPRSTHAFHLYPVAIDFDALGLTRAEVMEGLRARQIGTQVHYIPVYRHPYHAPGWRPADFPNAEAFYSRALSLPMYPAMADGDVDRVVATLREVTGA